MFDLLGYCWRASALGLCLVLLAAGALFTAVFVLPVLLLWPGDALARRRRVRRFLSRAFGLLLSVIALLGLGRVVVQGREWLDAAPGRLVVANHPTCLDTIVLLSLLQDADCVVKASLWRNPLVRVFARAAGYIGNSDPAALVDACVGTVVGGTPLVLFPEGTRTIPGVPLSFKHGVARVAVRGNLEILPVSMYCSPPALTRRSRWYRLPARSWRLVVRVHPPRRLDQFATLTHLDNPVAARRLTGALQHFFQRETAACERTY